jgi:hypothetical protein
VGPLRRLFGGSRPDDPHAGPADAPAPSHRELDEDERRYERELASFEQERLDDLRTRQLRYADRSWTPPTQGGPERSDHADRERGPEE